MRCKISGGALEHLSIATGDNKDIVSKLTEAVEQLKNKNAPLMEQLSESMNINLEKDKKLYLKAVQGQDPEGKILEDKAMRRLNLRGTFTRQATAGHMGSGSTRGTEAKRAPHQRQDIKGWQRDKISWGAMRQASNTSG